MDTSQSNAWLGQKIQEIRKDHPEQTIAVVAHQSEIKDGHLECIVPKEMSSSLEFRQDLNMSSACWLYTPQRLLLVQKGKDKEGADAETVGSSYRALGGVACTNLQAKKTSSVSILLSDMVASSGMVGIFENSFHLSNYEQSLKKVDVDDGKQAEQQEDDKDDRKKRINKKIDSYQILCEKDDHMNSEHAKFWRACAKGTEYARILGCTRGSIATPEWMEQRVAELVKDKPGVKEFRVVQADKLQELGMNLFYNVGKGADSQPRCVIVHYQGDPSRDEVDFAFVGKGVTYDTGGLNIKGTGYMEEMYGDKGGACAILGALHGTLEIGSTKNIVFACGFAENAIGSSVYKPGDIIKGMNGLSVEIGNTDAEGRLVLGDTFTYVQREFKPKQLIDLATLTGACMVALGMETAGLFSNDDAIVEEIKVASKQSFEAVWHMPITDEHKNTIKGQYGDIMNIGSVRFGGASHAAAFLLRFVEGDTKWAHLDIAGPAMAKSNKPPICSDQTGFGAGLLMNFIKNKN